MPSTTSCPYCGKELERAKENYMGRSIVVGYYGCQCEGAVKARAEQKAREAEREAEERRRAKQYEAEAEQRAYEARVRACGIMPRYTDAAHPMAEKLADAIESGRNAFVFGRVGTGKTHLVSAAAYVLMRRERKVLFTSMWRVLDAIKQGFSEDYDPMPKYQNVEVLILDDLGKESPTDFALERFFALVDERSARMLPTIVTTQYKPSELIERLAKNGDVDTAIAIVSRLRQDCECIELTGADRRR